MIAVTSLSKCSHNIYRPKCMFYAIHFLQTAWLTGVEVDYVRGMDNSKHIYFLFINNINNV